MENYECWVVTSPTCDDLKGKELTYSVLWDTRHSDPQWSKRACVTYYDKKYHLLPLTDSDEKWKDFESEGFRCINVRVSLIEPDSEEQNGK